MLGFIIFYMELGARLWCVAISTTLVVLLIYIGLYFVILRNFKIFREILG